MWVSGLALGFAASLSTAAQGLDRSETLHIIQSATSAAAFETAKTWLADDKDGKSDWWLKGNEIKFGSCTGEAFILSLAEWQKDALWLAPDTPNSWRQEAVQFAQKYCIDQLVKANIGRCKKLGGRTVCKAPQ